MTVYTRFAGLALCAAGAAVAFWGAASPAAAAGLRISPVSFELPASQRATSLSVRDDGQASMTVQVRVYRWTQRGGADVLEPTDALVASPPFANLDADAEQTVRLIRADTPGAPAAEQAYRLLVDELPPATGETGREVRLLMRHSVPVFVEPEREGRAQVSWRVRAGTGPLQLDAVNTGGRRLRIANVRLIDAQGRLIAKREGLVGYVLAGASMSFAFPRLAAAPSEAPPVRVAADTDSGPIDVALAGRS